MALNNTDFSTQLAHLVMQFHTGVLTESQLATQLINLFNDWTSTGTTLPQLAAQMSNLLYNWNNGTLEFRAWLGGSATGGYNSDGSPSNGVAPNGGYYPLRDGLGQVYYVPSPAKLQGQLAKGDPGQNAAVDVGAGWQYGLGSNEIIGGVLITHATTFSVPLSYGYTRGSPAATAVLHVKKNMPGSTSDPTTWADWATFTWAAGSRNGVFACSSPTAVAGDVIEFVAPSVQVANFSDGRVVIAG